MLGPAVPDVVGEALLEERPVERLGSRPQGFWVELLGRALEDKLRRSLDRMYRLLGLLYHIEDVAAARFTIEQGERRRRAAAVEYLDNLLGGVVRRRVMPLPCLVKPPTAGEEELCR